MAKEISRRLFLVRALEGAGAGLALVIAAPARSLLANASRPAPKYDWSRHSYIYLVDIERCIGCGMCVRACKKENKVPPDFFRTWVERYSVYGEEDVHIESPDGAMDGFGPSDPPTGALKSFFVPKLCNHCRYTPCTQVCPVGASYTTPDGVVLVDREHCIGCGYCVQACPYGSRYIHPLTHTADKCTWCYHRVARGMTPACVGACPRGARLFGDRKRENDPVFEMVRTRPVRILQPELLTKPQCFYLGADKEVR